jgi:hypothetical protein
MGLNKQTQSTNALYLLQGKIIKGATKETGTYEKNGKYYEEFNSISGKLVEFKVVDGYTGDKEIALTIDDLDDKYTMYFSLNSGYFKSFARSLENVDLLSNVELFPTFKEENGIKKSSLLMKQGEDWIKRVYTVDNMGKMPPAMPVEVNGKIEYDYAAQNKYLIDKILAKFEAAKLPF